MKRTARAWPCMLPRSRRGRAVAVMRVTEKHGRRTPGVDGVIWPTPAQKAAAVAEWRPRDDHPPPLRRVSMPKRDGRRRGLSLPTLTDRARPALHVRALEPMADTTAEPTS
jgi:RNA-directed DNA polymerase